MPSGDPFREPVVFAPRIRFDKLMVFVPFARVVPETVEAVEKGRSTKARHPTSGRAF